MPRPRLPYFPFWASDFLNDPAIKVLEYDEMGILVTLWSHMWMNDVKRGTLLVTQKRAMTDEEIADMVGLNPEKWKQVKNRLVSELGILSVGKKGELFSKRQVNFKSVMGLFSPRKLRENSTKTPGFSRLESESELKDNSKNPAPPAGTFPQSDVENSSRSQVEEDKKTVDDFLESAKSPVGFGSFHRVATRSDDEFRQAVKDVILHLANRVSQDWGEPIEDENLFVNKMFGVVQNLMVWGIPRKPRTPDARASPTPKSKMIKLIDRMSKPRDLIAELVDAVRKQPQYLP